MTEEGIRRPRPGPSVALAHERERETATATETETATERQRQRQRQREREHMRARIWAPFFASMSECLALPTRVCERDREREEREREEERKSERESVRANMGTTLRFRRGEYASCSPDTDAAAGLDVDTEAGTDPDISTTPQSRTGLSRSRVSLHSSLEGKYDVRRHLKL